MTQAHSAVRGRVCATWFEETVGVRAVVQRVSSARVSVERLPSARSGRVCSCSSASRTDDTADRGRPARRQGSRGFASSSNDEGKFDRSVLDTGGEILVVSQFTLLADTTKGNRPGFSDAARPEVAKPLVERFCAALSGLGVPVATGVFGATDERRARQRRTCHDRPRLNGTAARVAHACGRCYPLSTAFHCLTKWARGAHFC